MGRPTDLYLLIRVPTTTRFTVASEGRRGTQVQYSAMDLVRLRALACIVGTRCVDSRPPLDPVLQRLAALSNEQGVAGRGNFVAKYGALLHTDIALRGLGPDRDTASGEALATLRVDVSDGRGTNMRLTTPHWALARRLLDEVKPSPADQPAPGRDEMVRDWYRATAAWMQKEARYETRHLDHARELFADDPDILFFSGSQHEAYAGPTIQGARQSVSVPAGFTISIASDRAELRHAEEYFRRAVRARPDFVEAHLRLGHVLLAERLYAEAADELRAAAESLDDPWLQYYDDLMLGAAEENLQHADAARALYLRASSRYPNAPSPYVALSALARREGDRDGALAYLKKMFAVTHSRTTSRGGSTTCRRRGTPTN